MDCFDQPAHRRDRGVAVRLAVTTRLPRRHHGVRVLVIGPDVDPGNRRWKKGGRMARNISLNGPARGGGGAEGGGEVSQCIEPCTAVCSLPP